MNQPNNCERSSGGIGVCGALFLIFLTLKLCGVIHWSWLWVLAPLWVPFAAAAILYGFLLLSGAICLLVERMKL